MTDWVKLLGIVVGIVLILAFNVGFIVLIVWLCGLVLKASGVL